VDETGQPYAYTGDNPVNEADPMGLCTDPQGNYLVPGPCDWTSQSWVFQTEAAIQAQSAAPGYWAQVGHNFEDFADSFVGDPEAYPCSAVAGTLSGLSDALFDTVGAADGIAGTDNSSSSVAGDEDANDPASEDSPASSGEGIHSTLQGGEGARDIDSNEVLQNAQNIYYDQNGNQIYVWEQPTGGLSQITIRNPATGQIITNQLSTSKWVQSQVANGRWWSLDG